MSGLNRALLVEDNPGDARLLRESLKDARHGRIELVHVERLDEGLQRLKEDCFDVVLLDLSLPDAKGLDTVASVNKQAPAVPIVVLTGLDDEELAVEAVRRGAQDYLVKGKVDGSLLVRCMRYSIERKRKSAELEALVRINRDLAALLDREALLPRIAEEARKTLMVDGFSFRLVEGDSLVLAGTSDSRKLDFRHRVGMTESLSGRIVQENRIIAIKNVLEDPTIIEEHREAMRSAGYSSFLGVPLRFGDQVIGTINLYSSEEREFAAEEISIISAFADQAAIAIHNSVLYTQMKTQAVELDKSNKVKDEFLNLMSHELRTPLNVIMGYSKLVHDRTLGEINKDQEEALRKITSRSKNLLALITTILEATRIETQQVKAEIGKFNLSQFLDDLRLGYDLPSDKELSLNWDYPADLPLVETDSGRIRQILQHLINNAIQYTEKGSVTVAARAGLPREQSVKFKVTDTGVGIPREALSIIFEKFRQVDSSATRLYEGAGLGLYMVKKFTELLGGTVDVESEPDKGSIFTVTIPIKLDGLRTAAVHHEALNL